MSIGFLFWILWLAGVAFYLFGVYQTRLWDVLSVFLLVQVFLLGWGIFGSPIRRSGTPPQGT